MTAVLEPLSEDFYADVTDEQIPDEILDVAGAVQGGAPLPPGHPGRADALAAMHALGYSTRYIAEQLSSSISVVTKQARTSGMPLNPHRGFVDHIAVNMVVDEGISLNLGPHDMRAALPRLAAAGRNVAECARLMRARTDLVREYAAELGITLPEPAGECWWDKYVDNRKGKRR